VRRGLDVAKRIAEDSVPPVRRSVLAFVRGQGRSNTSAVATSLGLPTNTTTRALEDLALLGILLRTKESEATNAPNWWEATPR
jgi:predicted transcriptional regulator